MVKWNATGYFSISKRKWPPNNIWLIFLSNIIVNKYTTINVLCGMVWHMFWSDDLVSFLSVLELWRKSEIIEAIVDQYNYIYIYICNVENAMYLDDIDINEAWNRFIVICVLCICRLELYNTLCSQGSYITYINNNLSMSCAITIKNIYF